MESMTSNNCTDEENEVREKQWLASHPVGSKAGKPGCCFHSFWVYAAQTAFPDSKAKGRRSHITQVSMGET